MADSYHHRLLYFSTVAVICVSRSNAKLCFGSALTNICFFSCVAACFSGPVFFSDGRTHDSLCGAWVGSLPGGKKAFRACPEGFFLLWLPSSPFFSLWHLFFFWPEAGQLRGDVVFVFFWPGRFVFPRLFFLFGGRQARFPGWGPDGKLIIKFTFPNSF